MSRISHRHLRLLAMGTGLLVLSTLGQAGSAVGQQTPAQENLQLLAETGEQLQNVLGQDAEKRLSTGGQRLMTLADQADELSAVLGASGGAAASITAAGSVLPSRAGSDPFAREDFVSRFAGAFQAGTSVARCGDNVVLGFTDTGSQMATLFLGASPSGSQSFTGWSTSSDGGVSYIDRGALVADPLPEGIRFRNLLGDPIIACGSELIFYHSALAVDFTEDSASIGIAVSRSTDGGLTWGGAVMAVSKDPSTRFLEDAWMAVEPGLTDSPDDDVVHVTYSETEFSFAHPACGEGLLRIAIEYVRSTDGGATWSAPIAIEEECGDPYLQGTQVEAGVGDDVYVAWEHNDDSRQLDRTIRIAKSTDGGASFGAPQIVAPVTPVGSGFSSQGSVSTRIDLRGLAVDRSSGPRGGSVYLTWHEGGAESTPDPLGGCTGEPVYCFGDILLSKSTDGGSTWSSPARVNDDIGTSDIDQFLPAVDVDGAGNVWAFFYDRRRDPRNFLIDAFVARSRDGGTTWRNIRATRNGFSPFGGVDHVAVAADSLGVSRGVIVAWGDNSLGDANVLQRRFGTGGRDD